MGSYVEQKPWRQTPLVESTTLSKAAGCRIFLKLENLQPGKSFKSRGIGNLMLHHIDKARASPSSRSLHFYSSSGGNAGLACVTAATELGHKSTVVLPTSTEQSMILKLEAAGASEVIAHGPNWAHADQYLKETVIPQAEEKGEVAVYVPPFDNPLIWDGAATMIDEIRRQLPHNDRPDAIICSVGGGGLFAGIMQGLDAAGWGDAVQVLAVETKGAESLNKSVQAGELVTLPGITSIATSLGAVRVAERAFKQALRPNVTSLVFDDAEAAMGSWCFADDERMLVEPACGVSIALAYDGRLERYLQNFTSESVVVIIVCGGCRVDLPTLELWKKKYKSLADELGAQYKKPEASANTLVPSSVSS